MASDSDASWRAIDVAFVLVAGAMLAAVLAPGLVPFASVLRLVIGVPFVLFVPGYAVSLAVYPRARPSVDARGDAASGGERRDAIDRVHPAALGGVERVAFSVMASLVVVATVALAANATPAGIRAEPIAVGLGAVTLIAAGAAARARADIPEERLPDGVTAVDRTGAHVVREIRTSSGTITALYAVAAVSVVIALGLVATTPFGPLASESFSEYQLLSEREDGSLVASDHPTNLTDGENASVVVRVENHEGETVTYDVVVQLQRVNETTDPPAVTSREELDRLSIRVEPGESRSIDHAASPTTSGEVRLAYLFYKDDPPAEPDRESADEALHLWIDVSDADSG